MLRNIIRHAKPSGLKILHAEPLPDQNVIKVHVEKNSRREHLLFPYVWVLDHSEADNHLHPTTKQREINVFKYPSLNPVAVNITDGGNLMIKWNVNEESLTSASLIDCVTDSSNSPSYVSPDILTSGAQYSTQVILPDPQSRVSWDAAFWSGTGRRQDVSGELPNIDIDSLLSSPDVCKRWFHYLHRYGFSLLTAQPGKVDENPNYIADKIRSVAEKIGPPRNSIFGSVWDFTVDAKQTEFEHNDTAYSNGDIENHTDGTYYTQPGIQIFYLPHRGEGGDNTLVDGLKAAQILKEESKGMFDVLCRFPITGRYRESGIYYMCRRPAFITDHRGDIIQVTFNHYDRVPFYCPDPKVIQSFYEAYGRLYHLCNKHDLSIMKKLSVSDVLTVNNWRVMHGRKRFTGKRRHVGAYLEMHDFIGKLRAMRQDGPLI